MEGSFKVVQQYALMLFIIGWLDLHLCLSRQLPDSQH